MTTQSETPDNWPTLEDVERDHIQKTLDAHGWHKQLVARLLGIGRNTLDLKIKQYGLSRPAHIPKRNQYGKEAKRE
jgi:transcriptional regulator of acetoin/glycerol metabolism